MTGTPRVIFLVALRVQKQGCRANAGRHKAKEIGSRKLHDKKTFESKPKRHWRPSLRDGNWKEALFQHRKKRQVSFLSFDKKVGVQERSASLYFLAFFPLLTHQA